MTDKELIWQALEFLRPKGEHTDLTSSIWKGFDINESLRLREILVSGESEGLVHLYDYNTWLMRLTTKGMKIKEADLNEYGYVKSIRPPALWEKILKYLSSHYGDNKAYELNDLLKKEIHNETIMDIRGILLNPLTNQGFIDRHESFIGINNLNQTLKNLPILAKATQKGFDYINKNDKGQNRSLGPVVVNIDVKELIQKGESKNVEFKSTLRWDVKTKTINAELEHSVLKTICAFLNSEGGTLLIGVEDNKNIYGLQDDFATFTKGDKKDAFQLHIDNLLSNTFGSIIHKGVNLNFETIDGKIIGVVQMPSKFSEPVYLKTANKHQFYIRRSGSSIELHGSDHGRYVKDHWNS